MILIVGGQGSGKRAYARQLGYGDADMSESLKDGYPVVFHVEHLVAETPQSVDELFAALIDKEVVICDEVGSGVIPIAASEIAIREATGRLCVLLAQQADTVVRMVCGIPTIIKGGTICG